MRPRHWSLPYGQEWLSLGLYIPAEAVPNEPEVALHDPPEALYGRGTDAMELPTAAAATAGRGCWFPAGTS